MNPNETPLFAVTPAHGSPTHVGPNEAAMNRLAQDLEDAGLLVGKYAVIVKTLQQTARAVDGELSRGKVSVAVSNLTRMLLDGLEALPEPAIHTGDDYDTLGEIIKEMTHDALTGTDD